MLFNKNSYKLHGFLFILITCIYFGLASFTNGTGDDGDSISHFLFSYYSFKYPHLFLNMWNKPIFTILTSGFAQFGFIGVKYFNALIGIGISIYLYAIARHLKRQLLWLIIILPLCSPFYLNIINSSLTEPLFALALTAVIYYYIKHKHITASILVGFIPFIRQEGYIIIILFISIYIIKKQFKYLPFIILGHLFFSVCGVFYYGDLLWVFKNNSNISMSYYGHGGWFDYADKLIYILGIPLYILFLLGIIKIMSTFLFQKEKKEKYNETQIINLCLFSILFSHIVFWKFGFFKSFGMNRNIITVFPLIVYLAHDGLLLFLSWFKKSTTKNILLFMYISYLIIFPFTDNPAAINKKTDFILTEKQQQIDSLVLTLKKETKATKYYAAHPYVIYRLGVDPFDSTQFENIYVLKAKIPSSNSTIIWDSWFSVTEARITLDELLKNSRITIDTIFNYNNSPHLAVFKNK